MSKFNKIYSALTIDDIRRVRGYSLSVLRRAPEKIPKEAGVYIWRYWPSLESLDKGSILDSIYEIQNNFPRSKESLKNSRVQISVERTPFGDLDEKNKFFGIKDSGKKQGFLNILDGDDDVKQNFIHTMEVVLSASPPVYIGKAMNLRKRLVDHFDSKTEVLAQINKAGIPLSDIYISYYIDDISTTEDIVTAAIEEMLQRITNPPLTKRYG